MKRLFILLQLVIFLCLSCSKDGRTVTSDSGFSIYTGQVSDITPSSATVEGRILIPEEGLGSASFGIQYSPDSQMASDVTKRNGRNLDEKEGSFLAELYSLSAGKEYWYRAYVAVPGGETLYGDINSFTTSAPEVNITTLNASVISFGSVSLSGLTKIKGAEISEASLYFYWGESENDLSNKVEATVGQGGSFSANINKLTYFQTYWYRTACLLRGEETLGNVESFILDDMADDIEDDLYPIEGEAVDLGLPSKTKWCSHNLGTQSVTDRGDYYAWAATEPHASGLEYSWQNTPYHQGGDNVQNVTFSKYNILNQDVWLAPEDDAAACSDMEGEWRIPTLEQWKELMDNCEWIWIDKDSVKGYIVRGTGCRNIFLPAGGFVSGFTPQGLEKGLYWSSYRSYESQAYAYGFSFSDKGIDTEFYYGCRYCGLQVRPVIPGYLQTDKDKQ